MTTTSPYKVAPLRVGHLTRTPPSQVASQFWIQTRLSPLQIQPPVAHHPSWPVGQAMFPTWRKLRWEPRLLHLPSLPVPPIQPMGWWHSLVWSIATVPSMVWIPSSTIQHIMGAWWVYLKATWRSQERRLASNLWISSTTEMTQVRPYHLRDMICMTSRIFDSLQPASWPPSCQLFVLKCLPKLAKTTAMVPLSGCMSWALSSLHPTEAPSYSNIHLKKGDWKWARRKCY